jgi:predicted DNA-binding protein with PD1-like motif
MACAHVHVLGARSQQDASSCLLMSVELMMRAVAAFLDNELLY